MNKKYPNGIKVRLCGGNDDDIGTVVDYDLDEDIQVWFVYVAWDNSTYTDGGFIPENLEIIECGHCAECEDICSPSDYLCERCRHALSA